MAGRHQLSTDLLWSEAYMKSHVENENGENQDRNDVDSKEADGDNLCQGRL